MNYVKADKRINKETVDTQLKLSSKRINSKPKEIRKKVVVLKWDKRNKERRVRNNTKNEGKMKIISTEFFVGFFFFFLRSYYILYFIPQVDVLCLLCLCTVNRLRLGAVER